MRNLIMNSFVNLLLVCSSLVLYPSAPAQAATAAEIDAAVATTLTEFRKEVAGADEYLKEARGVLVVPNTKKVGFVVAAQWGVGALQVDGRSVGYYRMDAASAGFQAGFQQTNFVFIFFTQDALDEFRRGEGWTVGAGTGLTLIEVGAGVSVDTLKGQNAVAGFAFGKKGLMGGWSAEGTKFSRIEPERK